MKDKVVLAYSGGLDTSIIIPWLKENYDLEVIACCVNVGQDDDMEAVRKKAIESGASKIYIEDVRDEFIEDFAFKALKAGAVYEEQYLLGTSFARPLMAKRLVEIAHKEMPDKSRTNMFDLNLNLLERKYNALPLEIVPQRTKEYEQMLAYARTLSQGFPFVRVDLFVVKNKIYFGEMTFYPISGIYKFKPISFDDFLGSFLKLPEPFN